MPASRRKPSSRAPYLAAAASALIVAARFFPSPALLDAASLAPIEGARLVFPIWHVLLTPWTSLGDLAACSSRAQALALIAFTGIAIAFGRRLAGAGRPDFFDACGYMLAALALLAWGVLWPRDPARLELADPGLMAVDFHSHTSASWDGRSWFTPAANIAWHERTGFGATMITDHNRMEGARQARRLSATAWEAGLRPATHGLEGEELSLHGAHVLLLAPARPAEPSAYVGLEGLRRFLGDAQAVYGGLAVMSLPEYYQHHRHRLEELADWGARGFELISSSPKGWAVPAGFRREVVELCRRRNLVLTGGTDNHGYGSTACVWTIVRAPGWRGLDPLAREKAVRRALETGFSGTIVVVRPRGLSQPETVLDGLLDAPRAVWGAMTSWTPVQAAAALAWCWLPLALRRRRRQ